MSNVNVIGIDLAKSIFQVYGMSKSGKEAFSQPLKRKELLPFMEQQTRTVVGLEACGGVHHWGRKLREMGFTVKLLAPQFVKPYVMGNKTDNNDAKAIAEAVSRPEMKYVSIKTVEQQGVLTLHRVRELAIKQRSAQSNQLRGLLT